MASQGDQLFLQATVEAGFLRPEDVPEVEAARDQAERFMGRSVSIEHVLHQQKWLTPDQSARVQAVVKRRVMLCPGCWARINTFGLPTGQRLTCRGCAKRLVLRDDPFAEVLTPEDAQNAPPAPGLPGGPGARSGPDLRAAFLARGFELVSRVGGGGMGVVFKALQQPLGRTVAIKALRLDLREDARLIRRFFREAMAMAKVEHPNVVQVHHAGTFEGGYYIVMTFVDGQGLDRRIETGGRLTPAQALPLLLEVARGLEAAHRHGIVHRDVKPSNILIRADGTACLTDFGLARVSGDEEAPLTKTGDFLGTLNYMPPEQLDDPRLATPASDVYSLGATLFHALAGAPPFAGQSKSAIVLKLSRRELPRLDGDALSVSGPVRELTARMMAAEPRDRFQTMEEAAASMASALNLSHGGVSSRLRRDPGTQFGDAEPLGS
ncbi:MAG: serine/threonine protein kinase [Planctomycetes bacterium]|nr:serine/threonine protein kinase [Planctomycetota bacterium]